MPIEQGNAGVNLSVFKQIAKLRLQDRTQIALYAVRQGWLNDSGFA